MPSDTIRKRRLSGTCYRCGKRPAAPNRAKCDPCLAIARSDMLSLREQRDRQGVCLACSGRRAPNCTLCLRCLRRRYIYRARYRAKQAGVPFNLKHEDLNFPEQCPCCHTYLTHEVKVRGLPSNNTYSLDRIIPQLGYVADNVVMVCHRCNSIKRDAAVDELYRIADFYYHERKKRLNKAAEHGRPRGDD